MQGKPVFADAVEPLLLLEISVDKEESYVNAVDIESPGNDRRGSRCGCTRSDVDGSELRSIESESCGIESFVIIIIFNSNVISSQPRDLIAAPI